MRLHRLHRGWLSALALSIALVAGQNVRGQVVAVTNSDSNLLGATLETNLLLANTNATSAVVKPVLKRLRLVSHPDGDPGSRTRPKSSGAARFFDSVKSFFGVDRVLHLFNGKDLDNFYPWLADSGTFVDPDGVFSVEDGMIRISGQHQGFLATKGQFGDYKLVAEFKWGKTTWYKHKETRRNSGLFVNANGLDDLDMKSIELQIVEAGEKAKEGTGDIVLHGGAKMTVGTNTQAKPWETFYRQNKKEIDATASEWNKMEVTVEGDRVRITVNGKVALEGRRASPNSGKILLQSNGAELFIRRLDLYPLDTNNVPTLGGQGNTP